MPELSEVYKVINRIKGRAGEGYLRPTICQFYSTACDYAEIIIPANALTTTRGPGSYVVDSNGEIVTTRN